MVPTVFTPSTWLSHLLRRWVLKGYGPNISLAENGAKSPEPLEPLDPCEQLIAVIHTDDSRDLIFTDFRAIEHGETLFDYDAVVRCHCITDHPNFAEVARLKRTHYHRIIVEVNDGRRVVIERIGQAVFPLLRFIKSIGSAEI